MMMEAVFGRAAPIANMFSVPEKKIGSKLAGEHYRRRRRQGL
jgi:hypothetical protein